MTDALLTDQNRRRFWIVLLLSIAIAATRLLAIAHSLFDWDEALFMLGVRDYDIAQHHPHPPGYPLFIAAAKVVHLVVGSEFRSLQVVVVLASFFLFPALFWLARELGFDFATSVCGAALFAFLPNVWVYGGTAFGDIPSIALAFTACSLLLRGRRDRRSYLLGALVLGIAAGIRPPMLLLGFVPAVLATVVRARQSLRDVALAIFLGGAVVCGSYGGAALASQSVSDYVGAVRSQSKWVHDVDSWHNPGRPPLCEATVNFFADPIPRKDHLRAFAVLMLASLVAALFLRKSAPMWTLAIFAPLALLSWLDLDIAAASRYSIAYMAAYALLAADGIAGLFSLMRLSRAMVVRLQTIVAVALVVLLARWTLPALKVQRTTDAPPVAALQWIRDNVRNDEPVYVHSGLGPQSEAVLSGRPITYFERDDELARAPSEAWIVGLQAVPGAFNFTRPHGALWEVLRKRNFENSVRAVANRVTYKDGWHQEETDGTQTWRWMAREAGIELPPLHGRGKLSLRLYVPIDTIAPPTIELRVNGDLVDRFVAKSAVLEKSWLVPTRGDAPNELRLITSAVANPSQLGRSTDTRDLGLRLDAISWTPPWGVNR